jgi:hypothetical protein
MDTFQVPSTTNESLNLEFFDILTKPCVMTAHHGHSIDYAFLEGHQLIYNGVKLFGQQTRFDQRGNFILDFLIQPLAQSPDRLHCSSLPFLL